MTLLSVQDSDGEPVCFVVDPRHVHFGRRGVVILEGSPGRGDAHLRFGDGTIGLFFGVEIFEPEQDCPSDLDPPKLFRVKPRSARHREVVERRLEAARQLLTSESRTIEDTTLPEDERQDALERIVLTLKRALDAPWEPALAEVGS